MKNIPKNMLKKLAAPKNILKKLAAPKGSFLYQLTVSFIVGIMTLILLASIESGATKYPGPFIRGG